MDNLPLEIATLIASRMSSQHDVARMCLVSSSWLIAARPILYKMYALIYTSTTLRDTLNMLNNNENIKKRIPSLIVAGPSLNTEYFTIETDRITSYDLQGMDNIHAVYVERFQDYSLYFIQELVGRIYGAAPRIEKIMFRDGHERDWSQRPMATLRCIPQVLKEVNLHCESDSVDLLQTTFLPNPSAVTKLDLTSRIPNKTILVLLATIRFPILDIFNIFIRPDRAIDTHVIIRFLAAHPSIQKCSLDVQGYIQVFHITPNNILPNLRSLSTNISGFNALGKIAPSLHLISSLEIQCTFIENKDAVAFAEVARCIGGFNQLLCFKTGQDFLDSLILLLQHLEHFAPNLERLSHLEPIFISDDHRRDEIITQFSNVLNPFSKLQTIDLPEAHWSSLMSGEITFWGTG